jgi:hypothetical protein
MTQRKLTAPELTAIDTVYRQAGFIRDLLDDHVSTAFFTHLANMHDHQTSDGKPLRTDRVPTAADIGRRVKVRSNERNAWWGPCYFVGIRRDGLFVVESPSGGVTTWAICVVDQEAEG